MSRQRSLMDAIGRLKSTSGGTRTACLDSISLALRDAASEGDLETLSEADKLHIFQQLIDCIEFERQRYLSAASTKKTAHANRVSACSAVLRTAVELLCRQLRSKAIKLLFDHISASFQQDADTVFEPSASDYAKMLTALLSYQAHVEHLSQETWTTLLKFSIQHIQTSSLLDSDFSHTDSSMVRMSVRTSMSQPPNGLKRQVVDDLLKCMYYLTDAPNAHLADSATNILHVMLSFLDSSRLLPAALKDAFAVVNNTLKYLAPTKTVLVRSCTHRLLRLIQQHWQTKSTTLSAEMLISLTMLLPYIDIVDVRNVLIDVCDTMKSEYIHRTSRDRFSIDDLRLRLSDTQSPFERLNFTLSFRRSAAEYYWTFLTLLAHLRQVPVQDIIEETQLDEEQEVRLSHKGQGSSLAQPVEMATSRKRARRHEAASSILTQIASNNIAERQLALQLIAFAPQPHLLDGLTFREHASAVLMACGDKDSDVASWAYIALSSLALHHLAANPSSQDIWLTAWKAAMRAVTNPATGRAASHILNVLSQSQLVAQSVIVDYIKSLAASMDLVGPASLSDAALCLCKTMIIISQTEAGSSSNELALQVVGWLFRQWAPGRSALRAIDLVERPFTAGDVLGLVFAVFGKDYVDSHRSSRRAVSRLSVATTEMAQQRPLMAYLLLAPSTSTNQPQPTAQQRSNMSTPTTRRTKSPAETLLLASFIQELTKLLEDIIPLQRSTQSISAEAFERIAVTCFVSITAAYDIQFADSKDSRVFQQSSRQLLARSLHLATSSDGPSKLDVFLNVVAFDVTDVDLLRANSRIELVDAICAAFYERVRQPWHGGMAETFNSIDLSSQSQGDELFESGMTAASTSMTSAMLSSRAAHNTTALCAQLVRPSDSSAELDIARSSTLKAHILTLPDVDMLLTLEALSRAPTQHAYLSDDDLEEILVRCTETYLGQYNFNRSEVAISIIIDFMASNMQGWTAAASKTLHTLGMDLYRWFTNIAIAGNILSPTSRERLAAMLASLCESDPDYGSQTRSARTSLLELLKDGPSRLQYFLAPIMPDLFRHLTLDLHFKLLHDIENNLPVDIDDVEGIAMRLRVLMQIGSVWPSLLQVCVYHIFDTAKINELKAHATRCMTDLSTALRMSSPADLFCLYSRQLLFTWLEHHPIQSLPTDVFSPASDTALIQQNLAEIVAQVALVCELGDMKYLSDVSKTTQLDAMQLAFDRAFAYALVWDRASASQPQADPLFDPDPTCDQRIRKRLSSKDLYRRLARQRCPVIIGRLLAMLSFEGDEDRALEKRKEYRSSLDILKQMVGYSQSTRPQPTEQQPSVKAKYLPDLLERLCRRMGIDKVSSLWTPDCFAIASQMLLDDLNDRLSPLQNRTTIQSLRLLVAYAGPAALDGPQLQLTIRSLAPMLSDSTCSDDTIGILFYLFSASEEYLCDHIESSWATIMLLLLQIKKLLLQKHDSTTQESQHAEMKQRLQRLSDWLIKLLHRIRITMPDEFQKVSSQHISTLTALELPGNARKDTPESALLLSMLEESRTRERLVSNSDAFEVISALTADFEIPASFAEDILGNDNDAINYSQALWRLMKRPGLDENFLTWMATVVGRAYLATGEVPENMPVIVDDQSEEHQGALRLTAPSLKLLAAKIRMLCLATERESISLGVFAYRSCIDHCSSAPTVLLFEKLFPDGWSDVYSSGTHSYVPSFAQVDSGEDEDIGRLLTADSTNLSAWATSLVLALCRMPLRVSIVKGLQSMFQKRQDLSLELLPAVIHIVLLDELTKDRDSVRTQFVEAMSELFASRDRRLEKKQELYIKILLYLQTQEYPDERTMLDGLLWIPCNYIAAATCATEIGLPAAALQLAELSQNIEITQQQNRRSFSRGGVSRRTIPDSLLLSIYSRVNEPDSYYGVKQEPTLTTFLQHAEHERDGYRALVIRSAKLDAEMTKAHDLPPYSSEAFSRSLSAANLNSLAYAFSAINAGDQDLTLDKARMLQQWDVPPPRSDATSSALLYQATASLAAGDAVVPVSSSLRQKVLILTKRGIKSTATWFCSLGTLVEMLELAALSVMPAKILQRWDVIAARESWMSTASFETTSALVESRCSTMSALLANPGLSNKRPQFVKDMQLLQARSLASMTKLSINHGQSGSSMSAAWRLGELAHSSGLQISSLVQRQLASVLWNAGETSMSTEILHRMLDETDSKPQDVPISKAIILSQTGEQLASARSRDPATILQKYLKPSIDSLCGSHGEEAGRVFHTFAAFCDTQVQNASMTEDLERIVKLRQQKKDEAATLSASLKHTTPGTNEFKRIDRLLQAAESWLKYDEEDYRQLTASRKTFIQQSVKCYLRALCACDDYDTGVLRFYAIWLENCELQVVQTVIDNCLHDVPSWKFIVLLNQLFSGVTGQETAFQKSLQSLILRISKDHPYHTVHHLYAFKKAPNVDEPGKLRRAAADWLCKEMQRDTRNGDIFDRMMKADSMFRQLAESHKMEKTPRKHDIKDSPIAVKLVAHIPTQKVPPATIELPIQPDGSYTGVPIITGFVNVIQEMNGVSAPKVMTAIASDGLRYKQLFKGGKDDLRQDAVMEQVFAEVSKLLRKHKSTRLRKLLVRTYKVIPLSPTSGIIEFVPHSIAINDFLTDAHPEYYPTSMKQSTARDKIRRVAEQSTETRLKEYRMVCMQTAPVMRFFFFERFRDPDEWFAKRTTYTRTTAAISMLGYVLGIGDRHGQNIMIDEQTGEIIHIDLGVAFDAGRVLPVPELVPFRLTRDVVDGMGVTGIEGVFRRCCEFTMEALRADKHDIMTVLNVLRYDPLINWTLTKQQAKRIQEKDKDREESKYVPSKKPQQTNGAEEADRALGAIERKLSTTLSTAATVSELIQQALDERNLATLYHGWAAFL